MTPVIGLLASATVWGLLWYPYRWLASAGVSGDLAATLTYLCALALGATCFLRARVFRGGQNGSLFCLGLAAGWANIGFTLAVVYGDVLRVVLLFYLSPLWTLLIARWLLGERLTPEGHALMVFAFAGAAIMLSHPETGWPAPRSVVEWGAISSGFAFALFNVLSRRNAGIAIARKVFAIFVGGAVLGLLCLLVTQPRLDGMVQASGSALLLLLILSIVILAINFVAQHSLERMGANRAIVIYLFELVVTALSAWLLAGQHLTLREWLGGGMIVLAGVMSNRIGVRHG